jgi:hypothetical protein
MPFFIVTAVKSSNLICNSVVDISEVPTENEIELGMK